jgi:hypothetical protein
MEGTPLKKSVQDFFNLWWPADPAFSHAKAFVPSRAHHDEIQKTVTP